jgi:pimeloyl-ACP methyl ester carboxylesterase
MLVVLVLTGCYPSPESAVQKSIPTPSSPTEAVLPTETPDLPRSQQFSAKSPNVALSPGEILGFQDVYGDYFLYRPIVPSDPPKTLVVIHGTPAQDLSAGETALYYAENWAPFAEENGWFLIVPAFNQADFSSRRGEISDALTGYRGLFGREIGADEWVLRLLGLGWEALDWPEAPILLYGHSAGGQYVGRFLVTHPEWVEKAVISAAVTYPQPDPALSWPYGMGPLDGEVIWEDGTTARVEINPDPEKWLAATQVDLKVIVGLNDLEPQLSRPGQEGRVRPTIGQNWVNAMGEFAAEHGLESRISFEAIPSQGHSMLGLLPYCQAAFIE